MDIILSIFPQFHMLQGDSNLFTYISRPSLILYNTIFELPLTYKHYTTIQLHHKFLEQDFPLAGVNNILFIFHLQ